MKNFYLFYIFSLISIVFSSFHLLNINKNIHSGEGDLHVQLKNTFLTVKTNRYTYDWMQSESINLCYRFFKIPIFHGCIRMYMKRKKKLSASIEEYKECCEL